MKANITEHGTLEIERGAAFKEQHCYQRHDHNCRDVCPLFGEPEEPYTRTIDDGGGPANHEEPILTDEGHRQYRTLILCNGKYLQGTIVDKRPS